jgi:glutamate-ammonia-ligase adenylyltransferase
MYRETAEWLLNPQGADELLVVESLGKMGFSDPEQASNSWRTILSGGSGAAVSANLLASLLGAMSQTAAPDMSLGNFRRCLQHWEEPGVWLEFLSRRPRSVEILVRLFVNSQFLTELLVRRPEYLERLTESKRLAEVRSRDEFLFDMREAASAASAAGASVELQLDAVRRVQRWELLRIAACDCFGLMDLRRVTLQLSLLADATVQAVLDLVGGLGSDGGGDVGCRIAVVALGKLGGEELNYSSDIDLLFLSVEPTVDTLRVAQQLVRELGRMTSEGFLYRVDMRLRPWGRSGPLVTDVAAWVEYRETHAVAWELQALVKARVIAGDRSLGEGVLSGVTRFLVERGASGGRRTVREMKRRIEEQLPSALRAHGEVKLGVGSIRDIEFVTQYLQLRHVGEHSEVLGANTLRSLSALAAAGCLRSDQYRKLSSGYLLLRSIEHSLQLMHNKQVHTLPTDDGELSYLARRLDFVDADQFVAHYTDHCREIREVFDSVFSDVVDGRGGGDEASSIEAVGSVGAVPFSEPLYQEVFSESQQERHQALLGELNRFGSVMVEPVRLECGGAELTVVAFDERELLTAISGLLVVHGVDIVNGHAFTQDVPGGQSRCVDTFEVRLPEESDWDLLWSDFHADLLAFVESMASGRGEEALSSLTDQVARHVLCVEGLVGSLLPVEVDIDNELSESATVLTIRAEDTTGFLYECAHALSVAGFGIRRVVIETEGDRVRDRLDVVDSTGGKLSDPRRLQELKTVVVLIKHFTHLLPRSPNPLSAMRQFREMLSSLLEQDDWSTRLASLEKPEVLSTLARVLGVSEFLWQDFLRIQHETLFPLLEDVESVERPRERVELAAELSGEIAGCDDRDARVECLNRFKDREMFVADMRHIIWPEREFGQFSDELGDVAECVVSEAVEMCCREVSEKLGIEAPGRFAVLGLGKFGGRELGFASDIELMFVYDVSEQASGRETVAAEYYRRVVERLLATIRSQRAGVFELDIRLRPHGQAGPLASSLSAFSSYYQPDGLAWPFERQALVKLRAVAGCVALGGRIEALRDDWIYSDGEFDMAAMRAMRDRQVRQLVRAGTFNAKLSPGGLVDSEYLVQGWQLESGHRHPEVRTTNTLEAVDRLHTVGVLASQTWHTLRDAYVFQRCLIDALRVVRGDARDLTVPPRDSAEFVFLARRLELGGSPEGLAELIERHTSAVDALAANCDPSAA